MPICDLTEEVEIDEECVWVTAEWSFAWQTTFLICESWDTQLLWTLQQNTQT